MFSLFVNKYINISISLYIDYKYCMILHDFIWAIDRASLSYLEHHLSWVGFVDATNNKCCTPSIDPAMKATSLYHYYTIQSSRPINPHHASNPV